MSRNDRREEDGGYGNSSLVGSDTSGVRAARESREALDAARDRAPRSDTRSSTGGDLGRLAGDGTSLDLHAPNAGAASGAGTLGETSAATRASSGRSDGDRDSRDAGNSLQE